MERLKEKLKDFHFKISLIKSLIRIVGFTTLLNSIIMGVSILIIAELIGIIEEL